MKRLLVQRVLPGVLAWAVVGCGPPPPAQNLVLISLDTVRRDHLSVYGYPRPTTPGLERLAETSAVFEQAISQWTTTVPSHTSMLTGVYPHTHGVFNNFVGFPKERETLTEMLRREGFRTGGFVSGFPMRGTRKVFGRGFEVYDSKFKGARRRGGDTMRQLLPWLRGLEPDERYFLFVHFYDAHGPYYVSDEYLQHFRSTGRGRHLDYVPEYQVMKDGGGRPFEYESDYVDRYDATIRFLDHLISTLLAEVDLERTIVLITADHGETLAGRASQLNLNHGTALFREQIGIPFILRAPNVRAGRYRELVETTDILSTMLDLLGVPPPADLDVEGRSLASLLQGRQRDPWKQAAYSSTFAHTADHRDRGYALDDKRLLRAAVTQRWKLIVYPGVDGPYYELFDRQHDAGERHNLAAERPEIVAVLAASVEGWRRHEPPRSVPLDLTPEDVEKLRALGYLAARGRTPAGRALGG